MISQRRLQKQPVLKRGYVTISMENYNFTISAFSLIFTVILRVVAGFYYIQVVKKSAAEAGVHNGLLKLRRQLLGMSVALFLIDTFSMTLLIARPFINLVTYQTFTDFLSLFNSVGFLLVSVVMYAIYTQQYTPASKSKHEHIEILEKENEELRKRLKLTD